MIERRAGRQHGLSFIGLVALVALLVSGALLAVRLVPPLLEYQAVRRAADRAAEGATVAEIRTQFDRSAQVDDVTSIAGKDLEVARDGDRWTVAYAYQREIHLAGPAYLTLKFAGRARARP